MASDGGIFTYGDAQFYGSTGAIRLNKPIAGMAPTPDGQGYWLVASDGGIFTYGDAAFYGSLGADDVSVLGIMIDPSTAGYTLVQPDGTASSFPSLRSASTESSPTGGYTTQPTVISVAPGAAALADDCQPTTNSDRDGGHVSHQSDVERNRAGLDRRRCNVLDRIAQWQRGIRLLGHAYRYRAA